MHTIGTLGILAVAWLGAAAGVASPNSVRPAELHTYATLHSIGMEWNVTGDANHNARCRVAYRRQGTQTWRRAMDLFRIDYYGWYGDNKAKRPYNMLAGSILFLEPGTAYEVRLELEDPDGGGQQRTAVVSTRPEPVFPRGGRTWNVVPGTGSGDGSPQHPFRGLKAAQAAARPGDVIRLHAGQYGQFTFDKPGQHGKYLAYVAAGDGPPVFEQIIVAASHLWLEGLALRRAESGNGLRASGSPRDVVVRRCLFEGYHYSVTLTPGSKNWYIADNIIVGDKKDPDKGDISGEGIELNHSSGHDVAYNRIERVADGISYPHHNCDLYGNDIRDVTDDGLEPDYGYANVRMWGNRIHRAFYHGVSFQPQYCGPWYIVRNEISARGSILKPNVADRFVLVHNTLVAENRHAQRNADLLLKSFSRNNLWILLPPASEKGPGSPIWYAGSAGRGQKYAMEYQPVADWRTDVDYDGFDWGGAPVAFRWEPVPGQRRDFADLASFAQAVGIERHARRLRKEELFEIQDLRAYIREPYSARRLTLRPGSPAIDAGQVVPNLSDTFQGAAPDLGAYEFGLPPPHYGPRTP